MHRTEGCFYFFTVLTDADYTQAQGRGGEGISLSCSKDFKAQEGSSVLHLLCLGSAVRLVDLKVTKPHMRCDCKLALQVASAQQWRMAPCGGCHL
jgi:hypothetical protein